MAQLGRRTRLSDKLIDDLTSVIALGVPEKIAYESCNVPHRTYYGWKDKGREAWENGNKKSIYCRFFEALQPAEAQSQVELIKIVRKHAPENWQAAMTMLERRWPGNWARQQRVDLVLDWPIASRVIELIKDELIYFSEVAEEYGDDLASQLFQAAGISVQRSSEV